MTNEETKTSSSIPASSETVNMQKEIDRINHLMVGVVIFVVVSVLGTFFLLLFDFIKEKDLYLRYNDLYDNYSEKNSSLIEKINNQEIEIVKKEQRISELEKDDKKLLDITDCLRNKKYWQYEQCFK